MCFCIRHPTLLNVTNTRHLVLFPLGSQVSSLGHHTCQASALPLSCISGPKYVIFLHVYMYECLPSCMCIKSMSTAQGGQKRVLGALELELEIVVRHRVGVKKGTHVLCKSSKCSSQPSCLQSSCSGGRRDRTLADCPLTTTYMYTSPRAPPPPKTRLKQQNNLKPPRKRKLVSNSVTEKVDLWGPLAYTLRTQTRKNL